jgi:hypothetical protein
MYGNESQKDHKRNAGTCSILRVSFVILGARFWLPAAQSRKGPPLNFCEQQSDHASYGAKSAGTVYAPPIILLRLSVFALAVCSCEP